MFAGPCYFLLHFLLEKAPEIRNNILLWRGILQNYVIIGMTSEERQWDVNMYVWIKKYIYDALNSLSLRGKWVPRPTKKGVLWEKNHISINFWSCVLGLRLRANTTSRWDLHYWHADLVHYTKYWLLKLADLFQNITSSSQLCRRPSNRWKTNIFCFFIYFFLFFWFATHNEVQRLV